MACSFVGVCSWVQVASLPLQASRTGCNGASSACTQDEARHLAGLGDAGVQMPQAGPAQPPPPQEQRADGPPRETPGVAARSSALDRLARRPLPAPPATLRVGPLRAGAFPSPLHDVANAARLGTLLGVAFSVCMLTGLYSHLLQHQPDWLVVPSRPADLYRVSQGLHVTTGLASVPLLLAKLWVAYPGLFVWPPARDVGHAVQRGSLFLLVGGAVFQVSTGVANVAKWYPFGFSFTATHYWVGWITVGALLLHVAAHGAQAWTAIADGSYGRARS